MSNTFNKFYLKGSNRWGIRINGEESRVVLGTMNEVNALAAELESMGYCDSKNTAVLAQMMIQHYPKAVNFS